MDKERQIRFLYPPLFLIFAILLAFFFDEDQEVGVYLEPFFGSPEHSGLTNVVTMLAGGGAVVLVLGFLIGTFTHILLCTIFVVVRKFGDGVGVYEAFVSHRAYLKILDHLRVPKSEVNARQDLLYAAATFDHEKFSKGLNAWMRRRWTAFWISSNSALALLLATLFVCVSTINPGWPWYVLIGTVFPTLILHACTAWRHTMGMLEFQAFRHTTEFGGDAGSSTEESSPGEDDLGV